jgi:hypothetical protein
MATIIDLKEHIENGGKIRRPCWDKDIYIYLNDDYLIGVKGFYYSKKELLLDDWEVYEEPFKITHTGLYKTRAGKKAFVSVVKKDGCVGIIEGNEGSIYWDKSGLYWDGNVNPEDIVAEWES